jgi:arylsulfatase A
MGFTSRDSKHHAADMAAMHPVAGRITRLWAAVAVFALLLSVWPATSAAAAERLPNFIIIITDDQGYQDLGCFGSPDINTPNIDRMAAEGMKFTDFYVSAPVCSPSRASLMTGCYCERVSLERVFFPRDNVGLHPNEITIAELLKAVGYATACIGKWHLGHLPPFLPTSQGFDSYFGIPYSNDMSIRRNDKSGPPVYRNQEIVEHPADQATLTKRYTEEALRFIEQNKDKPFFLYLPHTMPHTPLHVSDAFRGKSRRGLYGDVIEEIDWSVGEVLNKLRELKLAEHTLVIFTSDNGPWLIRGPHGGSALPLRAGKGTIYEGGMRVPCVMWWPGRIPAGKVCSEVAATIDLLPTLARLAGANAPDDRVIDGRDIWPLMSGQPGAKSPHEYYFFRGRAVRWGKWKFYLASEGQPSTVAGDKGTPTPDQLYDLSVDISEKNNVASEHPEVVARLTRAIAEHNAEVAKNRRPLGKVEEPEGR